ncbi:MAG: aminotransferase class V-fold PLP-dependent enzyme, partial [Spirochaetia bacterium]
STMPRQLFLNRGVPSMRSEEEFQPFFFPDRFESGTPNGAGIAGLGAALEWLEREGKDTILRREQALAAKLTEGLASVPGITLYGAEDAGKRTGVVSFTVDNIEVSEIGEILDDEFGIMTRVGLHCAPAAHKTIGTFPSGTVRMSAGAFTTPEDIDTALQAVCSIRGGSSTGSGRSGY